MPKNEAAWLVANHEPLQVKEAPCIEPQAGEILVRNRAVAINPVDWMIPYLGNWLFAWIKYPFILGSDLAGDVVALGEGVTNVKVGDRVLAMAAGAARQRNRAAEGAFQKYTIVLPRLTAVIPAHLSYVLAAVIPLGLATAACGLFQDDLLSLKMPSAEPERRDQWVIVWGGATSVGCNAIQLAVAAGYSVVAIASPRNFEYVKSLGAACAFDYKSRNVVRDVIAELKGKVVAGALSIGAGSTTICIDILAHCQGRKFVASCSSPISLSIFKGRRMTVPIFLNSLQVMLYSSAKTWLKSHLHGVTAKFFDASSVIDNEVGRYIYQDYIGNALASSHFRPAPPPQVVGSGLGDIQTAFDIQREGVSAAKIVVALD